MVARAGASPSPGDVATGLGLARVAVGAVLAAAPAWSVRMLGVDAATARRVSWLARMTATRDAVIGAGTLWGIRRGNVAPWLLAGAAADAADAVVLGAALRQRRIGGVGALGGVLSAGAAALAGCWAAGSLRR